jgi:hypothetical protein
MWKSAREKIDLFPQRYLPVSYPQSGIICGTNTCRNQALVWLTFDEEKQYQGERIFTMPTACAKVQIQ